MDTLLIIIFVGIMKFLTYYLREILTILMFLLIVGFFLSIKDSSKKSESEKKKTSESNYMQFGQYMEKDDKRHGGGAW